MDPARIVEESFYSPQLRRVVDVEMPRNVSRSQLRRYLYQQLQVEHMVPADISYDDFVVNNDLLITVGDPAIDLDDLPPARDLIRQMFNLGNKSTFLVVPKTQAAAAAGGRRTRKRRSSKSRSKSRSKSARHGAAARRTRSRSRYVRRRA